MHCRKISKLRGKADEPLKHAPQESWRTYGMVIKDEHDAIHECDDTCIYARCQQGESELTGGHVFHKNRIESEKDSRNQ